MKKNLFFRPIIAIVMLVFLSANSYSQCSELIFNDEFTGNTVDLSKWTFDNGDGCPTLCGWGNAEEQWYQPENTTVQNGNLVITTRNEAAGGKQFTSSKLITSGKFSSRYGRYEASIKLPSAGGIWPAFWMLPENGNWPFTGEIDIMESQHKNPESIGGTVHYSNGGWQYNGREFDAGLDLSAGFHEYAVEWEPTEIRWYVDDQLYHTVTPANTVDPWPFSEGAWYIILNVAVGGPGTPYTGNISPTPADYPTQMEVDYVRVYSGTFNTQLTGDNTVYEGETNKVYSITPTSGAAYSWSVPSGASIISGQGTNTINVNWGSEGGDVSVEVNVTDCGVNDYKMSVSVEPPRTLGFIYEDFESNRNLNYGSTTSGTLIQSVANPGSSTINNSSSVGRYQRDIDSQYDVLFMESDDIGNSQELISGKRTIWMEVFSDAPIGTEFILQLENGTLSSGSWPSGRHSRYTAKTTTQNEWETLEFELLDRPDMTVGAFDTNQFALLIDANSNTQHTVYFDNLRSMIAPDTTILDETIIANYDGINQLTSFFENGIYTANVGNPTPNDVNNSANVASYTRNSSEQYDVVSFSTAVIENSGPFKEGDNIFLMDIYTSAAVGTEITLSLENETSSEENYPIGRNSQYSGVVSEQNTWHTVVFTHAASPDAGTSNLAIDEISILFDPNSNSSDTYYFDNFRYGTTTLSPTYNFSEMIQDYNGSDNLTFDSLTTGSYIANVSNPSANTVNESSQAGRYVRNSDELYDVLFFDTNFITDASAYVSDDKRFAMDIYTSAPIGTVVSWQLEASTISTPENYPSGRHSVYQATVKEQNNWHTLEFILTGTPDLVVNDAQIDNIVFLFDPNSNNGHTFYIDNLRSLTKDEVIQVPVLSSIVVSSVNAEINQGETAQFNAQGFDQNGEPFATDFNWTSTGGSIDTNGLYTGSEVGTYTITSTSGSVSGSASITVNENSGSFIVIPGIIQAEDYKEGGTGVGYFDTSAGNTGGAYRQDDVDIQNTTGGYNVGWIATGEWLAYDINATASTNSYDIYFRVASPNGNGKFHLELDGVAITEVVSVPNTNGWQNYQIIEIKNVSIDNGQHELRVVMDSSGLNFDYTEFISSAQPSGITIPGVIEAENYNEGGEGVGYHDTSGGNTGGAYRQDDVDIESTTGGYNVGWIAAEEWLAYDINATASSNNYDIDFLVASPNGNGSFHLELDGVSITDVLPVPNTGDWQNYQVIEVNNIVISNGSHQLRIVFDSSGLNIDKIELEASIESTGENGCSGVAENGHYNYAVSSDTINPTITFIPEVEGMGDAICILYYGTSNTGPYPGYIVNPNIPFEINANSDDRIYFYYTYSLPSGGENNTANAKHDFLVGSCNQNRSLELTDIGSNVFVYPNPMLTWTEIVLPTNHQYFRYRILDVSGKVILDRPVSVKEQKLKLDVSQNQSGLYFLKLYGKTDTKSFKLLKK
ncbi:carbohydrate-binding protein [Aquimarina sp. 2201CG14-23]|uniref:carbohydrate-binding protein n=1 Tax=Aquimarina mycalae TaxID=3040073 RepID=UPI0024780A5D|nr:carbohydrate-binding protein [Aquimarina sp. 2201CG14-23]MDH7446759.1 carbohydrate-binding protein [Aquimarina sp. 2201CG14-23]